MRKQVHWPLININRRLAGLLLLLMAATIGSIVYLSYALTTVNTLIKQGTTAVGDALVLQELFITVQSAESAQRGYIITGDSTYLTAYRQALVAIPQESARLNKQPALRDSMAYKNLQSLLAQKLAELKLTIDTRQSQGQDAAIAIVATNQGKALMDKIRLSIAQLSSSEFKSIIPREAQSQGNINRALGIGTALVVFVMALCVVIVRFFQGAIMRERAVEGAKNEFLSLASHQLRTPATNVRQYLGLVLEGYLGKLTKDQRAALEVADRNNNTEISIINDLLNVAKLDLNKIQLRKVALNVADLVNEVALEYRSVAEVKQQKLKTKIPVSLPEVAADVTYLKSVLENLVDNACKYSPPKSTITVRLAVAKHARNKFMVIEVTDSGIGISKRDVSKLFKKFSRLPSAINSAEGTGLGLYWVKQIVELHGGTISIESAPKKGSTFRILLPTAG